MKTLDPSVEYVPMIRDLPKDQRPRERLQQQGPEALTTAELLAILLRTGQRGENVVRLAERLLGQYGGLAGLARMPYVEICKIKGLGPAKAAELLALFELARRVRTASPETKPQVKSPGDAANLLTAMGVLEQEQMRVLLLDTKNRVQSVYTTHLGSLHTTVVRVAEIYREAVRANAAAIIVAHNHPSGDPSPSPEDVALTRELVKAGKLLDIELLDHLVIGAGDRFASLKERGLGFEK